MRNSDDKNNYGEAVTVYRTEGERGLLYTLVKEKVLDSENETRAGYSVFVCMTEAEELSDAAFVYDITSEEETAQEVLRAISCGGVTPITLRDIIEDMISDPEHQIIT